MISARFSSWLIDRPRWLKRCALMSLDFALLSLALWSAYCLRLGSFYMPSTVEMTALMLAAPAIGVIVFHVRGLYRLVTRFIGPQGATRIYIAVVFAVLVWALVILLSGIEGVPRSVVVIYGLIAASFIRVSRQAAGWILRAVPNAKPAKFKQKTRVLIYGAGATGVQLLQSLRDSETYKPVGFVDDEKSLWSQIVNGLKVYRPDRIPRMVERDEVDEIFLALSHLPRHNRRAVIRSLEPYPVMVKTLPGFVDIASGRVQISDLRPIDVDDLLGRDPVPPDDGLLARNIRDKAVLITGGGGSIGSELARQVAALGPSKLVLLDVSETALYEIEIELADGTPSHDDDDDPEMSPRVEIVPVLGSAADRALVERVLAHHAIDTIYHAAAYKHVPLVEDNPVAGLENNTFATQVVAEAARAAGVERFVLISTDKAVRPANVMGASKRLAELVLQAMADAGKGRTVFTMVRFGNVLDSSGSVVRRFRKQIHNGGPVTVTHPNIIRYFMSIPEAAQLVIQAGAMASGGDVFVLDMGSPVKIDDLARTMVRLSGLEVRDPSHPNGDIEISYVGLRRGEKLFEELLIGKVTTGTKHPRILKNSEPFLPLAELDKELKRLAAAMQTGDLNAMRSVFERTVEGYTHGAHTQPAPPVEAEELALGASSRTLH